MDRIKDTHCSLHVYFTVKENKQTEFTKTFDKMLKKVQQEPNCLYYNMTQQKTKANDTGSNSSTLQRAYCREGYKTADDLLFHVGNVGPELAEIAAFSDMTKIECHCDEKSWNDILKDAWEKSGLVAEFWEISDGGSFNKNVL